jgi:hypothetical protein
MIGYMRFKRAEGGGVESQRLRAASRSGSGTRSDLERSSLRNILVARIKKLGQTRPR